MKFKIKWGDFKPLLKKRHITEQETKSPIFYFETELEIFCYQANEGYTTWSSLTKDSLENLKSFKMEFLSDAIELLELPVNKNILVIKQE